MTEDKKWGLNCVMLARRAIDLSRGYRTNELSPRLFHIKALNEAAFFRRRATHYLRGNA